MTRVLKNTPEGTTQDPFIPTFSEALIAQLLEQHPEVTLGDYKSPEERTAAMAKRELVLDLAVKLGLDKENEGA